MIRSRDDRGAVAIIFAFTAFVLMVIAALSVDLGQAWAEKRQQQHKSDMATLAGAGLKGADLPAPSTAQACSYGTGALASHPAAIDIASYLGTTAGNSTITAGQLTDCNVSNGEIFYGIPTRSSTGTWTLAYNKNQLSLVSPPKTVDYGLARLIGINSVDVFGQSTVEIKSPKMATLPFYAFTGCDYGPQTLQQPNNGNSAAPITLYLPNDTNNATLTSVAPPFYPAGTATGTLQPIDILGANFTGVTDVGFFESGNATAGPVPVVSPTGTFTIVNDGKIHLNDLPDQTRGVTGVQTYWYIRVKKGGVWSTVYTGNGGSPTLNAPRLTIGTPPLVCGQGSSSGNFGTILLSHAGYSGADNEGAANVAIGLDSTLSIYPTGGPADGTCSSAQTTTVLWTAAGTNCVDTDTGMSANVATGGFLGLGSSATGTGDYLLKPRGKTKCNSTGTGEATSVVKGQTVNNDPLTCFFLNNTTNIGNVDNGLYAGPPLISSEIYNSPRFGYVPVLPTQPANGGSKKYQIIDFRACFITDQPPSAQKGDQPSAANGIVTDNNGVQSVQVVFLNGNALPNPPVTNGTINFTGSGIKIPVLVN